MSKLILMPYSQDTSGLRAHDVAMVTVAVLAILAALAHCTFQLV
jgi:hypothetical protein